eukprot:gene2808-3101_t
MAAGYDIISYANDLQTLKQEANNQLSVQEAWVVWEPLTALNTADTTHPLIRKVLQEVHDRKPDYDLFKANCVWFVREVIEECCNRRYIADPASMNAIQEFNWYFPTWFSKVLGNVLK